MLTDFNHLFIKMKIPSTSWLKGTFLVKEENRVMMILPKSYL